MLSSEYGNSPRGVRRPGNPRGSPIPADVTWKYTCMYIGRWDIELLCFRLIRGHILLALEYGCIRNQLASWLPLMIV
jgi:hypothetical protein